MRPRIFLMIIFFLLAPFCVSAQSVDEMLEAAKNERTRLLGLSEEYRNETRRLWMEYLSRPWTPVEADEPLQRPLEDDPDMPVMLLEAYDYDVGETFEIPSDVLEIGKEMYSDGYFDDFPVFKETVEGDGQVSVRLNGFELVVRCPDEGMVSLKGTTEKEVAAALDRIMDCSYQNTLRDLSRAREILSLSDWSFVKLVERFSDKICGSGSLSESVLLQAYILNQFGFHLCLGRSDEGRLYKLMAVDADLYDYVSYGYEGERFYLLDDDRLDGNVRLTVISLPSGAKRPMHMRMNPDEKFHMDASKEMKFAPSRYPNLFMAVSTDLSRMEFYGDYPMFYTEGEPLTTYFHHAMMPVSDDVKENVYAVLKQAVAGRSELEAVNILLNVVQTSFPYLKDKDVWGRERYFFPDELWCYGGGDCEDKSILFSRLVRDILKMPVALVYWPGHLSCAVRFTDDVKGAYFNVGSERFVSCDPTYENAYVGAVMNNYRSQYAELILLP